MAELEGIGERADRSRTFELIRMLADPTVGEVDRERIVYALGRLGDPRAVVPLGEIGRDLGRPVAVRRAALGALADSAMGPEGAELRGWWGSGDDVVRGYVLRQCLRSESDLVEPVASDPGHPLHRDALSGIGIGFEEPHWQRYKIAGLGHPDPAVRRTAAYGLGWDEPVAAESALHAAATDTDADVACAAIDSLRYYLSRATLRLLHGIAQGDDERAEAARVSEAEVVFEFEHQRSGIGRWLVPVMDLLGPPEPAATSPAKRPRLLRPQASTPSMSEIVAVYSDPDGEWAPKLAALRNYDWDQVPAADRSGLAAFFSGHPDPEVRGWCCSVLQTWHEADALVALAHDPELGVRKSAVYNLRFVPRSAEIAALTWNLVASGQVAGTHGYEALATCAAHTPPGELDDRLIDLARNDLRENIRLEAVSLLEGRIEPLLPLLAEPPLVTWGVHVRLLDACGGVRPTSVDALYGVDNLHVAAALATIAD